MSLFNEVVKLAHTHPELRRALLPVIREFKANTPSYAVNDAALAKDADPESHDQNLASTWEKVGVKTPGVILIEKTPDAELVFRSRGGDLLGEETNPGYYLRYRGVLKRLVTQEKPSSSGESKAKKLFHELLVKIAKSASRKTASGPETTGRNWRHIDTMGKSRWVWTKGAGDISFTITSHAGPGITIYKLNILMPDGEIYQTYGQKDNKEYWFKRASELYKSFHSHYFDLSRTPEKWVKKAHTTNG
jgi:hypothetical protein